MRISKVDGLEYTFSHGSISMSSSRESKPETLSSFETQGFFNKDMLLNRVLRGCIMGWLDSELGGGEDPNLSLELLMLPSDCDLLRVSARTSSRLTLDWE